MGLGEMPLGTGRVLSDLSQTIWFPCQKAHHTIQAKKSNKGSSQQETKPSAEALPSKLVKVNSGLHSQTNYPHSWALYKKTLVHQQNDGGKAGSPTSQGERTS